LSAITVLIPNIYFRNTLDIFISSYIIQSCDFEMTFYTCAFSSLNRISPNLIQWLSTFEWKRTFWHWKICLFKLRRTNYCVKMYR
jgi:hypothetical protein